MIDALATVLATDVTIPHLQLSLLALVVAGAGFGELVVFSRLTRPRRPRTGATTQELRSETPAVVDLLVGGFATDSDAIAATLVDLAARRFVEIDELGGSVRIRVRNNQPTVQLNYYEGMVLGHVRQVAGADGWLPAEALTTGPRAASAQWRRSFSRAVIEHAQSLGLCRTRWDLAHLAPVGLTVIAAGFLLWLATMFGVETDDPPFITESPENAIWIAATVLTVALISIVARIKRSNAQRDTDEGLAAASHWLGVRTWYQAGLFDRHPAASVAVWDRHLAYATAMGSARLVERQLCFDDEQDRLAWSKRGGQYRRVRVRYRSIRPGWGESPWLAIFKGAAYGLVAGGSILSVFVLVTDLGGDISNPSTRRIGQLVAVVLLMALGVVLLWNVVRFVLGVGDLFGRRTVEGTVIRARVRSGVRLDTHTPGEGKPDFLVAIDDGSEDRVVALRVKRGQYSTAQQGSEIRMVITPGLGHVRHMERIAQVAGDDPVLDPPAAF